MSSSGSILRKSAASNNKSGGTITTTHQTSKPKLTPSFKADPTDDGGGDATSTTPASVSKQQQQRSGGANNSVTSTASSTATGGPLLRPSNRASKMSLRVTTTPFTAGSRRGSTSSGPPQRDESPTPVSPTWGDNNNDSPPTLSTVANLDSNVYFTPNATLSGAVGVAGDSTTSGARSGGVDDILTRGGNRRQSVSRTPTVNTTTSVGGRMRFIREGKGLTVEDVAAALRIPSGGQKKQPPLSSSFVSSTTTLSESGGGGGAAVVVDEDGAKNIAAASRATLRPLSAGSVSSGIAQAGGGGGVSSLVSSPTENNNNATTGGGVGSLTSIEDGSSALESWARIFFMMAINLQVPVDALLPIVTPRGFPIPPITSSSSLHHQSVNINGSASQNNISASFGADESSGGGGTWGSGAQHNTSINSATNNHGGTTTLTATTPAASPLLGNSVSSLPFPNRPHNRIQSCGGRLRELRQRAGVTGLDVTDGTPLTTAELLGLEAGSANSAYEKWGNLLGRFCSLTSTSAFSLISSACVLAIMSPENEGRDSDESDSEDREEVSQYAVDDHLLDGHRNYHHHQSTAGVGGGGRSSTSSTAAVGKNNNSYYTQQQQQQGKKLSGDYVDDDDAFGLNPAFVFGSS